ncbi:MAG TPA: DNA repair protein RecO [Rhizomicrobium sp.]|jgi:DNA repair protein RecO (recombination protein O)
MEWNDDAIGLSVRRHGESGAILEALTRQHGRHLGLVHGGASRRIKSLLMPGNSVAVIWRARTSENLGSFAVEMRRERAGALLERRETLIGLNAFAAVARGVLPEREPHASIFDAAEILLDAMAVADFAHWGPVFARWESGVLEALGFGLDLARCAATGSTEELCYVSPKTGRAVSRQAGAPYRTKLFELPQFLAHRGGCAATIAETAAALRLTGHFLGARVLHPQDRPMPAARLRLDELAARESA